MMNSYQIERVGVNAVKTYLNDCCMFVPHISENDKSAVFDGSIEVYNNEDFKITNLKGYFPLQVKGRENRKGIFGDEVSYQVPISHLRIYAEEGGCAFFLVDGYKKEKFETTQKQIYYRLFSTKDIKSLLAGKKDIQNTISVRLNKIPENKLIFIKELNAYLDEKLMSIGDWEPLQTKTILDIFRIIYNSKELQQSSFLALRTDIHSIINLRFTSMSNWRDIIIVYTKRVIEELNGRVDPIILNFIVFEYALFLQEMGLYSKAEIEYIYSVYICQTCGKEKPTEWLNFGKHSLTNLAQIHIYKKDYKAAEKELKEVIEIISCLDAKNEVEYIQENVLVLNCLGTVYMKTNNYGEADKCFEQAIHISEEYLKVCKTDDYFLSNIADIYCNLSTINKERRKYDLAYEQISHALEIYRGIVDKNPELYSIYLAKTLNNIATIHKSDESYNYEEAETEYTESLEILRKIELKNPDYCNPVLADVLYNYATFRYAAKDYTKAKALYEESLKIYMSIRENCPEIYDEKIDDIQKSLDVIDS